MKDTKEKIDNARILGFIGGVIFANAIHAAIVLPAGALRLSAGAKGKHNLHCAHGHHVSHEAAGPLHFLAEQHAQEAQDEHVLLDDIKADLDDIKASLKEKAAEKTGPEPPKPDKEDKPESPKP